VLYSLLYHPGNTLLALIGIAILALSIEAHSDQNSLLTSFGDDYSQQLYETKQATIIRPWLEENINQTSNYYEGDDAWHELAENALTFYWKTLMKSNHSDNHYPVINGHLSTSRHFVDYGIHFSSNTVKLRVKYSF